MKYYRDAGPSRWRVNDDGTVEFYHPDWTGHTWVPAAYDQQDLISDVGVYPCELDTEAGQTEG